MSNQKMTEISEKDLKYKLPFKAIAQDETIAVIDARHRWVFTFPLRMDSFACFICLACNSYFEQKEALAMVYEAICTGDQEAEDKAIGLIEDLDAKAKGIEDD